MSKVLFCEDDATIRKLIRVALRGMPHELLLAEDGAEGLELARRERPAAIFTDLAMPRLDGYALCEAVRGDPVLRDTPVVVVTASAQRAQLDEAVRRGASATMLKPFTMEELRAAVARWAGGAGGGGP